MAEWFTINGVPPYDGRYELDIEAQPLTVAEWRWVKRHAGYLPLTLTREALADPDFVVVQAVIAVHRAGTVAAADVPALIERFENLDPFGAIEYERDAVEDDADPPPPNSDSKPSSDGDASPTGSASSAGPPSPTGPRRSDTSASVPATSVS